MPTSDSASDTLRRDYRRAEELIDAFVEGRRERNAADAAEIRLMSRVAALMATPWGADPSGVRSAEIRRRSLIAELAVAARLSEWSVSRLVGDAADLCERFEPLVSALADARISSRHVEVIHDEGRDIVDAGARAAYTAAALERAEVLTPGRLRPVVRILSERYRDRSIDERHADAACRREVRVHDLSDAMSQLTAILPSTLAHGILDRLTQQARSVIDARGDSGNGESGGNGNGNGEGGGASEGGWAAAFHVDADSPVVDDDVRSIDQVRADVFADLLLTGAPSDSIGGAGLAAIRGTVQITVPVLTMTGQSAEPCLLAGCGPIDTDTARALAASAPGWERVMTSPVSGEVLAVDRYRPGAALTRFLVARDEHCRFPGCRMPVWRCDVDHTKDAAHGGPTDHGNLAHACRRHHVLKHNSDWSVEQVTPGVLVWTSPSGRRHTDRPEPQIRFVPDDEMLSRRRFLREPWRFGGAAMADPHDRAPF